MASYRQPFEGHANYGTTWFAVASATEQHFTSEDYGLTCAVSAPVGMGNLLFIGGASYQKITYELLQNFGIVGVSWRGLDQCQRRRGRLARRHRLRNPAIRAARHADLQFGHRLRP